MNKVFTQEELIFILSKISNEWMGLTLDIFENKYTESEINEALEILCMQRKIEKKIIGKSYEDGSNDYIFRKKI